MKARLADANAKGDESASNSVKSAIALKQLNEQVQGMDQPQNAEARTETYARNESFRSSGIDDPAKFVTNMAGNLAALAPTIGGSLYGLGGIGVNSHAVEPEHMATLADLSGQIEQFKRVAQNNPAAIKDIVPRLLAILPSPSTANGYQVNRRAIDGTARVARAQQVASVLNDFYVYLLAQQASK